MVEARPAGVQPVAVTMAGNVTPTLVGKEASRRVLPVSTARILLLLPSCWQEPAPPFRSSAGSSGGLAEEGLHCGRPNSRFISLEPFRVWRQVPQSTAPPLVLRCSQPASRPEALAGESLLMPKRG